VGDENDRGLGISFRRGGDDLNEDGGEELGPRTMGLGSSFFGGRSGSSFFSDGGGGMTFGSDGGGLRSSFLGGSGGGSSFSGSTFFGGGGGGTTFGSGGGSLGSTFLGGSRGGSAGGGVAEGGGAWGVGHLWLETAALGTDKRAGSTVRWVSRREKTNIHNEKGNAVDGLSVGDIFLMNSHRRDLYRVSVVVCVIGWRQPKPAHRAASKLETALGSTLFTASNTLTQASQPPILTTQLLLTHVTSPPPPA
jgi:hypothetical protein